MQKEKQVTKREGRDLVQLYFDVSDQIADKITNIWNNNEGVEYDDNTYENMEEWLQITCYNGYDYTEIIGE